MKKYFLILTATILLVFLASCNLDGVEGLYQAAGNSTKQESYKVLEIVGKSANGLYVATDRGLADYRNRAFHLLPGTNGNTAKNVIAVTADDAYIYNNGDAIVDQDGNPVPTLSGYICTAVYSKNGEYINCVFKSATGFSVLRATPATVSTASPEVLADPVGETIDSVSIIGDGIFLVTTKEGTKYKHYTYEFGGSLDSTEDSEHKQHYYWGKCKDITLEGNGKLSNGTSSVSLDSVYTMPAMHDIGGNKTALITFTSNKVHIIDDATLDITNKTISGLNSLEVISILGYNSTEELLYVMTGNSGSWVIDLQNETKSEVVWPTV